jgi:hypothetical protein
MNIRKLMKMSLWPVSPCARFGGDGDDPPGGGGEGAVSLLDENGCFVADFWEKIDDDDLKGEPTLKELAGLNVKEALKMTVNGKSPRDELDYMAVEAVYEGGRRPNYRRYQDGGKRRRD